MGDDIFSLYVLGDICAFIGSYRVVLQLFWKWAAECNVITEAFIETAQQNFGLVDW